MTPELRTDGVTPGMLSEKGKHPWREKFPMSGFYRCAAGDVPHFLTTGADSRQPLFVQCNDFVHAYVLPNVEDFGLSAKDYYNLCELNDDPQALGPPGTQPRHGNS